MPPEADIFAPVPRIEAALAAALDRATATPRLRDAMKYAVLGPGKRLRPLLAWHCCEALGGRGEDCISACVAVELVHCFSLVHDDLPALDNDALRRGKPTVHVNYGEAMAILAGDALLNLATFVIAEEWDAESDHTVKARKALLAALSEATASMIAGQVADTLHDFPPELTDQGQRLEFIHRHKTGALLKASCVMGVHCAFFERGYVLQEPFGAITSYGESLGLLFQAVDDLLDVTQTTEHTGKRTNKDAEAGKLTFPGVYGIDRTRELITQYRTDAIAAVKVLGRRSATLIDIADLMASRTK